MSVIDPHGLSPTPYIIYLYIYHFNRFNCKLVLISYVCKYKLRHSYIRFFTLVFLFYIVPTENKNTFTFTFTFHRFEMSNELKCPMKCQHIYVLTFLRSVTFQMTPFFYKQFIFLVCAKNYLAHFTLSVD